MLTEEQIRNFEQAEQRYFDKFSDLEEDDDDDEDYLDDDEYEDYLDDDCEEI